jgi:hypothetical protein
MKKSEEERKVEPESGSSSTELPAWARKRKKVKPKSKGKLGSKQRAAKVRNKKKYIYKSNLFSHSLSSDKIGVSSKRFEYSSNLRGEVCQVSTCRAEETKIS